MMDYGVPKEALDFAKKELRKARLREIKDNKFVIYRVPKSTGGFQLVEVKHNCTKCMFSGTKRQCKRIIKEIQDA